MSFVSENIIPGKHGKTFSTNARNLEELLQIKRIILKIPGINKVILNNDVFPREFVVQTKSLVSVAEIQEALSHTNYHAIPKSLFKL